MTKRIKLITPKHLDEWGACCRGDGGRYDDATLKKWLKGRKGLTPLEVANLRQVSVVDRVWVLARPEVLGEDLYLDFGYACADRAVRKCALKHLATREWARRWLSPGRTTREEAWAAAYAAAHAAAYAAAHAAAYAAAKAAERRWQLAWLRRALKESA